MTLKEQLDAEYEDRLLRLQQNCDHVVNSLQAGRYGCCAYGGCSLCESQIQFHRHLRRNTESAISIVWLRWERLGSPDDTGVMFNHFGRLLTNVEIEAFYKQSRSFESRTEFAKQIMNLIRNQPMSKWCDILGY